MKADRLKSEQVITVLTSRDKDRLDKLADTLMLTRSETVRQILLDRLDAADKALR